MLIWLTVFLSLKPWSVSESNSQPSDYATIALPKRLSAVFLCLKPFGLCQDRTFNLWIMQLSPWVKAGQLIRLGVFLRLKPILFVSAVKLYFYPLFNCVRIVKQNVNPVTN